MSWGGKDWSMGWSKGGDKGWGKDWSKGSDWGKGNDWGGSGKGGKDWSKGSDWGGSSKGNDWAGSTKGNDWAGSSKGNDWSANGKGANGKGSDWSSNGKGNDWSSNSKGNDWSANGKGKDWGGNGKGNDWSANGKGNDWSANGKGNDWGGNGKGKDWGGKSTWGPWTPAASTPIPAWNGGVQKPWMKPKGKGKGGGGGPVQTLPEGFQVDVETRYSGTVQAYYKLQGYGFIAMDAKGLLPQDKLFVHWTAIQSADRFPSLMKDMQVEFNLKKADKKGQSTILAENVTAPGGAMIAFQDESDGKKTFVGGQHMRYNGKLKFFLPKRGYGYITVDDGYQFEEEVPKELRVELAEVNAGGKQPAMVKDFPVEFGIWKTQKGAFKAYNMTCPGGAPLPSAEQGSPSAGGPIVPAALA